MNILGNPEGVFDLNDSDKSVGSFLLSVDICNILQVSNNDLSKIEFERINGLDVIDERKLQKLWYDNLIPNAIPINKSSLDELLLMALIRKSIPDCIIERQIRISRFLLDFKLTYKGKEIYIEFDGPSHFAISRYGHPKHSPFRKKNIVEDKTGTEVVNWAYWIQRCEKNIKVLFDIDQKGLGVLWSTNIHFGDFVFENSAQIIIDICNRFNAIGEQGLGCFYGPSTKKRNNPEHPIVQKIIENKENIGRLLPKGFEDKNYWLPNRLKRL